MCPFRFVILNAISLLFWLILFIHVAGSLVVHIDQVLTSNDQTLKFFEQKIYIIIYEVARLKIILCVKTLD